MFRFGSWRVERKLSERTQKEGRRAGAAICREYLCHKNTPFPSQNIYSIPKSCSSCVSMFHSQFSLPLCPCALVPLCPSPSPSCLRRRGKDCILDLRRAREYVFIIFHFKPSRHENLQNHPLGLGPDNWPFPRFHDPDSTGKPAFAGGGGKAATEGSARRQ